MPSIAQDATASLPIDKIAIGDRVRKDMGDLQALADSMKRHGLLHPVVVLPDMALVAGARRIEAAKLVGWSEIPVRVVSVEDLLSAERDENAERKNFTPSEAAAIGKLLLEHQRQRAKENQRESGRRLAARNASPDLAESTRSSNKPHRYDNATEIVARAVGMHREKFKRASEVVAAAESDPATFGDLVADMDETGKVAAAHREMQRRRGQPARHAVHAKTRHPKAEQMIEKTVVSLDGLAYATTLVPSGVIDKDKAAKWAKSMGVSLLTLRKFMRRIQNGKV